MYVKCQRNWSPPKTSDLSRPFRKGRVAIELSNAPIALPIGRPNSAFCDWPRTVGFVREARLRHRDAFRPVSRIPVSPEASITRARQGELPKAVATGVPSREARRSRSLRPTVVVGIALRAIRAPTPDSKRLKERSLYKSPMNRERPDGSAHLSQPVNSYTPDPSTPIHLTRQLLCT